MSLSPGQPAPWFVAPTPSNSSFVFDSAAGRYVLLLFAPEDVDARAAAVGALARVQHLFDEIKAAAFVILRDPTWVEGAKDVRGLRWAFDKSGKITEHYGPEPHWLLLDPTLRVIAAEPIEAAEAMFRRIDALPSPAGHAGGPLHAPVLVAPRIFEPELCRELIARHEAHGGDFTGVMRDKGRRTVAVMDELKKRRDIWIDDPELVAAIRERLERRLFPLIKMAFEFQVTRVERFLVSCYDVADGGVFRPHRDNTTQGTAHRRFACSLNLNEDFAGGELRFAEYGEATYRAPPGGAVVFSCSLLHEALPITAGRRYAFLPFLHDEAAEEVLEAYRARTAEPQDASA